MVMNTEEIDAKIAMLKNRIKTTSSHIGRVELEHQLAKLIEMKKGSRKKEPWEM